MTNEHVSRFMNRRGILKLLTNEEIARVAAGEAHLDAGDEYLDLGALAHGVRRADGSPISMRRVLPRKAVRETTWSAILAQLENMAM